MVNDDHPELWRRLIAVLRVLLNDFAVLLKADYALTLPQFDALDALAGAPTGALSATELSQAVLYSSGSTTHLVDRLEERGLLTRSRHPRDARRTEIRLTEDGARLAAGAQRAQRHLFAETFGTTIQPHEVAALSAVLERIPILREQEDGHTAPPRSAEQSRPAG